MGFIGYAVKLIHIPINNILVLNALFGGLGLMIIRSLEIDFHGGESESRIDGECYVVYNTTSCESN